MINCLMIKQVAVKKFIVASVLYNTGGHGNFRCVSVWHVNGKHSISVLLTIMR